MPALDKAARLAAETKAQAEKVKRLDPPFPFKVKPFDAKFFDLR